MIRIEGMVRMVTYSSASQRAAARSGSISDQSSFTPFLTSSNKIGDIHFSTLIRPRETLETVYRINWWGGVIPWYNGEQGAGGRGPNRKSCPPASCPLPLPP